MCSLIDHLTRLCQMRYLWLYPSMNAWTLNRDSCELSECFLLVRTKYSYWYILHAIADNSWKMNSLLLFTSHSSNPTGLRCASSIYSCFLVSAVLACVFGQNSIAVIEELNKMLQPRGDGICIFRFDVPPKMSLSCFHFSYCFYGTCELTKINEERE